MYHPFYRPRFVLAPYPVYPMYRPTLIGMLLALSAYVLVIWPIQFVWFIVKVTVLWTVWLVGYAISRLRGQEYS